MNIIISRCGGLRYITSYPRNYQPGQKYPVILLLHGAGSRGDNIDILTNNSYFAHTSAMKDFPFITVAPQCPEGTWFDVFEQLKDLADRIYKEEYTDRERFYLMGVSMGGYGAWQLAMSMPEIFAALVPICGGGMSWNTFRLVNVPVWAFHGALDTVVYPEESARMVDALNSYGGSAKLTIYPENEHDAWNDTYSNPLVYEWLLSHRKTDTDGGMDAFTDSEIYG